ncbi:MAG: allantoicase [Verrucomicrobiota bacterium]
MSASGSTVATPAGLVDLASTRIGGIAIVANDEFFAEKENLLKPGRGIFIPDKYTDRGKWMDGWESRRRRTPGNDWCVVQLGLRGVIQQVDIDTNHFLGNHPSFASLDAYCLADGFPTEIAAVDALSWAPVLAKSSLNPGSQNLFAIKDGRTWTHVRLNIFPDGGVARLRVYGTVVPDWSKVKPGELVDLAAVENGGVPLACSDMFFSSMNNLIMPGRAENMGDGWETKRRRGPGYDWIILKLGKAGTIRKVEIDTNHFKGNYPDMCSIDGCFATDASTDDLSSSAARWSEILPKTKLQADKRHFFEQEISANNPCSHVRFNIYPDGGVSRLRVWGTPV